MRSLRWERGEAVQLIESTGVVAISHHEFAAREETIRGCADEAGLCGGAERQNGTGVFYSCSDFHKRQ